MKIKKTRTRTSKSKTKKTLRKNKGGAPPGINFIGQGTYGCTYSPAIKCLGEKQNHIDINSVSKLMTNSNAYNELNETIILDLLNYDKEYKYHLPSPKMCTPNIKPSVFLNNKTNEFNIKPLNLPSNSDDYYDIGEFSECKIKKIEEPGNQSILIYQNGGLDFDNLYSNKLFHPSNVFKSEGLLNILKGLIELHKIGLIHLDIKGANIVTGIFTGKEHSTVNFKIIDFGLLSFIGEKEINIDNPDYLKIIDSKDILAGPHKKIRTTPISNEYVFYPLYNFLFTINKSTSKEDLKTIIDGKINWLKPKKKSERKWYSLFILDFYKTFKVSKTSVMTKQLYTMFYILKHLRNKKPKNLDDYYKKNYILIKKIDYYSFGVMLLIYLNNIKLYGVTHTTFSIVKLHLYHFLNNSGILYNNFDEINPEQIKNLFTRTCADIISGINDYKMLRNSKSQSGGKNPGLNTLFQEPTLFKKQSHTKNLYTNELMSVNKNNKNNKNKIETKKESNNQNIEFLMNKEILTDMDIEILIKSLKFKEKTLEETQQLILERENSDDYITEMKEGIDFKKFQEEYEEEMNKFNQLRSEKEEEVSDELKKAINEYMNKKK